MSEDIRRGKGLGYRKDDGTIGMIRCFNCGRENHGMAVHSGVCAWCSHDGNEGADDDA